MAANKVTFEQLAPGDYLLAHVSLVLNGLPFDQVITFESYNGAYSGALTVSSVEGPVQVPLELSADLSTVTLMMTDGSTVYQGPVNASGIEADLPSGVTMRLTISILTFPTGGTGALNINDDKYVEVQRRYLDG